MRPVLIVQNVSREGPGLLEGVLEDCAIQWVLCDLERNDKFPCVQEYSAVVVLGGPDSANDDSLKIRTELERVRECLKYEIPYLGICLGMQILVRAGGGSVVAAKEKEVGFRHADNNRFSIQLTDKGKIDALFKFNEPHNEFVVFQLHGETVVLTHDMLLLGTDRFKQQQIVRVGKYAYGLQCHFELTRSMLESWCDFDDDLKKTDREKLFFEWDMIEKPYTIIGKKLFRNFLSIAGFNVLNS